MNQSLWDRKISPRVSLFSALLLIVPFFLITDPVSKSLSLIPLMIPLFLMGKPGRIFPTLITFTAITLMGLYPAAGKELFRWSFFSIGSESLQRGMGRAALFCGMILLSRMAIRPGLTGKGSFFAGILAVFENLKTRREDFRRGNPAEALDRLLLDCDAGLAGGTHPAGNGNRTNKTTPLGWVLVLLTFILTTAVLFFHRIYSFIR